MLEKGKTENQLAAMGCKQLALTMTKGIVDLNKLYSGKVNGFLEKSSSSKPVAGMHHWLRVVTPYWFIHMLIQQSPAMKSCMKKGKTIRIKIFTRIRYWWCLSFDSSCFYSCV